MVDEGGGRWAWSDGTPTTHEAWDEGQPEGAAPDETCATQDALTGTWTPAPCTGVPTIPGFLCRDAMP